MKLFCPSCGSPIEFRYDESFVRVCDACHSAIARTDRGIDTLGQFADLAPAGSGLSPGAIGRFGGQPFELMGRAEYAHPAGGSWEEWYVKLGDGRWGWLSHAHGQWAMTFRSEPSRALPGFEQVAPGLRVTLGADPGVALTVGERNQASLRGAEGELPFLAVPGSTTRFVDASDDRGRAATIDYGPPGTTEEPVVYLGRRTSLDALGLAVERAPESRSEATGQSGERLACPSCGGSIELRVPDESLCVTCSYCGSLLDCEGPLAILARLAEVAPGRPAIELGATGAFEGARFVVTGRLRRMAKYPGGFVEWDEYLLHAPRRGYRWLTCVRGHYSFVSPLAPGAVSLGSDRARYGETDFRLFDRGAAEVTGVWGEFYWKVALGEVVQTADYVAPPAMLSRESSDAELHWSLGVYQTVAEVRRAFGKPELPDETRGVAAHQPFRHAHWWHSAVLLVALLFVSVIVLLVTSDSRQVYTGTFQLGSRDRGEVTPDRAGSAGLARPPYVFFTPPFELSPRQNTSVQLDLPLQNSWAFATVDLVHEASGELRSYGVELSHYSGVEGGESWSEGNSRDQHLFSAGRGGSHVLRLELQTPAPSSQRLRVTVAEDVFAVGQLGIVLLSLCVPSGLIALAQYVFERARWSESDFAPSYLGSADD